MNSPNTSWRQSVVESNDCKNNSQCNNFGEFLLSAGNNINILSSPNTQIGQDLKKANKCDNSLLQQQRGQLC